MSRSGPCLVAVASVAPPGTAPGGVVEHLAPSSRARTCSVLLAEPLLDIGVPGCPRRLTGGGGSTASGSRLGGRPQDEYIWSALYIKPPKSGGSPPLFLI